MGKNHVTELTLQKSMKRIQRDMIIPSNLNFNTEQKLNLKIQHFSGSKKNVSPYGNLLFDLDTKNNEEIKLDFKYLVFISHGLEGNPFDMRHIRAAILDTMPNCIVYIINNNYKLTNDNINLQAKRFAIEVKDTLNKMNFYGKY